MQDCSISSNAQCKMAHLNNIGYTSGTTYICIYSTTIATIVCIAFREDPLRSITSCLLPRQDSVCYSKCHKWLLYCYTIHRLKAF